MAEYLSINYSTLYRIARALRAYGIGYGKYKIRVDTFREKLEELYNESAVPHYVEFISSSNAAIQAQTLRYYPASMTAMVKLVNLTDGSTATFAFYFISVANDIGYSEGRALIDKKTLVDLADLVREISGTSDPIPVHELAARIGGLGLKGIPTTYAGGEMTDATDSAEISSASFVALTKTLTAVVSINGTSSTIKIKLQ